MGFKQVPRPRGRIAAAAAIAALACLLPAAPAWATSTFAGSSLTCTSPHGSYVFPGDDVGCTLSVQAGPDGATGVTATIDVPADMTWVSGGTSHTATTIFFDGTSGLGSFFGTQPKGVVFHMQVAGSAAFPETMLAVAHLSGTSGGTTITADVSQNNGTPFTVAPADADLTPSTIACQDDSPSTPLLPGDVIDCQLTVSNATQPGAAQTQNATNVTANVALPSLTSWLSGGSSHTSVAIFFGGALLGEPALPGEVDFGMSGQSAAFQLTLSPDMPGSTSIAPRATISYTNQIRGTTGGAQIASTPLITSPGPARLQGSNVRCIDTNGGVLLPGDDVTCTLTVLDRAGREDIDDVTAVMGIPLAANWASGGSGHTASTVTFALGNIPAGSSASQVFHLTVDPSALVGATLGSSGVATGTSVPLGGPITQIVTGNSLLVGSNPAAPPSGPSADLSMSAVLDKPGQPVKVPSKGTTPAHIVVTLSNAGPSIAQQPSFGIGLPAGAEFNSFDPSDTVSCGRVAPTKAVCTLTAGALGAQSSVSIGVGLGLSAIANDPGTRVISLSAASATPDPTGNDAAFAIAVQPGAGKLTAHPFTIDVRPGRRVKASVLRHVTGRSSSARLRVTVPTPGSAKKGKRPKAVKGSPKKGTVSLKGTTITYTAKRNAKGSDSFRYTVYDGRGNKSSATVKVSFVKPKKGKKH